MNKRIGELDCFVLALQVLCECGPGANYSDPQTWTIRDAHVWLYWAGMTSAAPPSQPTNSHWRAVSAG